MAVDIKRTEYVLITYVSGTGRSATMKKPVKTLRKRGDKRRCLSFFYIVKGERYARRKGR